MSDDDKYHEEKRSKVRKYGVWGGGGVAVLNSGQGKPEC